MTLTLPAQPHSASKARALTRQALQDYTAKHLGQGDHQWVHEWVSTVQLVVTEMVTNVILHAQTPMQVVVKVAGHQALVAVSDESPKTPQLPDPITAEGPTQALLSTGRGLLLISTLSKRWGVCQEPGRKTVWACIACHAPNLASSPKPNGKAGQKPADISNDKAGSRATSASRAHARQENPRQRTGDSTDSPSGARAMQSPQSASQHINPGAQRSHRMNPADLTDLNYG